MRREKYNFPTKKIQVEEGQLTYAGSQSLRKAKISSSKAGTLLVHVLIL